MKLLVAAIIGTPASASSIPTPIDPQPLPPTGITGPTIEEIVEDEDAEMRDALEADKANGDSQLETALRKRRSEEDAKDTKASRKSKATVGKGSSNGGVITKSK